MTPQFKNNTIPGLPKLSYTRYENIFNVYTFVKEGKNFYFYNLNNKIQLPVQIDSAYLETISLDRSTPWTILAHRLYKNMNLWYLLYSMNKRDSKPSFTANLGDTLIYIKPEFVNMVIDKLNE
jgi:hypothetical protein